LLVVLLTTFIAFCALYAPQPILPRLAAEFAVSPSTAALLITVTLIPLGLAPIVYGYLLEAVPARSLLMVAVSGLALCQLAFALVGVFGLGFAWLVALRVIQGLLFPAIFTALVTYSASMSAPSQVRRSVSFYIATTIFGGFAGRALGGALASQFDWQAPFWLLGVLLGLCVLALRELESDAELDFARLDPGAVREVLAEPIYRYGFLTIFAVFFCFAALLNSLPFRMLELDPDVSDLTIALMYTGYLIGIGVALSAARVAEKLGGEVRAVAVGTGLFLLSVLATVVPDTLFLFVDLFLFCAGNFLVHGTLSGFLNQRAQRRKGVVNGLYIAFYYCGGAIGSFAPAIIYRHFGWEWYIATLCLLLALAFVFIARMSRALAAAQTGVG
jgi:YNFM family putative membrane transporter